MPKSPVDLTSQRVAQSYDCLDEIYRNRSALHVHHGLWLNGDETRKRAKEKLASWVADCLALRCDERCVDIGSGYGETARQLSKDANVRVTAVTNSTAQHSRALRENRSKAVEYKLADWCCNDLPTGEYDAAWAIESIEHMVDLELALRHCRRVLKPHGRLLILTWLAGSRSEGLTSSVLLRPLVKDAKLAPLRTKAEMVTALSRTGFIHITGYDLTSKVRHTWSPTVKGVLSQLRLRSENELEPGICWRTMRIALAYSVKALSYGAILAICPQEKFNLSD